jgi:two-component system, LytTR family, sensor kinase
MNAKRPSANERYAVMRRGMAWFLLFLVFTALGFLNFAYRYLDDLARDHPHTFGIRLFEEGTGAYAALALFPALLWAVRKFRIRRDNWWKTFPLNLLVMVAFSICDTTLMALSRKLLAPLFGLGPYDYGIMVYRYPMEFANHVIGFWFCLGAIYLFDSYQDNRHRQIATAELEARLAEAQLQNLRLQLQPHFLFNALNTISSVMHEDVDRADAMLAQLSDLLRRTLRAANSQEIALEEELAMLKSYLAIMEARFGDDLQVDFAIDPAVSHALVPQLILQPLVENSIRHGREAQSSRVDIHVRAVPENGRLLLEVSDNGPGIPNLNKAEWKKGIGISNTEERLEGLYGTDHELLLENCDGRGLSVKVRLPLRLAAAGA